MERPEHEREEGPERIERLPGEVESAMYTGADEGEPTPGSAELGPLPDREETLQIFERADELIEGRGGTEEQTG